MTTSTVAPADLVTAGAFLFGDADVVSALQTSGAADIVGEQLGGFAQATCDQAAREFSKISAELLDFDLTHLLLGAWRGHAALRAAGQRTAAAPHSEELVDLVKHQVSLDHQPTIDLVVNGTRVASVHFALSLLVDVEALTATVRAGRLIGLRVGRCDLDASVSIEGKQVASRQGQLQLPLSVQVGSGIALVPNASSGLPGPRPPS